LQETSAAEIARHAPDLDQERFIEFLVAELATTRWTLPRSVADVHAVTSANPLPPVVAAGGGQVSSALQREGTSIAQQ
jgi:hypothetical protein